MKQKLRALFDNYIWGESKDIFGYVILLGTFGYGVTGDFTLTFKIAIVLTLLYTLSKFFECHAKDNKIAELEAQIYEFEKNKEYYSRLFDQYMELRAEMLENELKSCKDKNSN